MKTCTYRMSFETTKAPEFIDITEKVCEFIKESQVLNGFAVVYSKHTTAAIKINENEPLLLFKLLFSSVLHSCVSNA